MKLVTLKAESSASGRPHERLGRVENDHSDIILTGTPDGVGAFREPPVYLKDGDKVVVEIDDVGRLVNYCRVV